MENKKRVATVHLNGIVESIVFDSLNRGKERMELYLSGDLVAVIPHGCFVKLFDYKESKEAKSEDIVDEAIRHAESIRKEATDFGKFLKLKPYLMDDIELAYEVFVGHVFEEVTNGGGNGARGNIITKDFEAYSAPNEHNMEKGDDEWYKNHMGNQGEIDKRRSNMIMRFSLVKDNWFKCDNPLNMHDQIIGENLKFHIVEEVSTESNDNTILYKFNKPVSENTNYRFTPIPLL